MSPIFDNFKNSLKTSWKAILCGLSPFILLVIVFALPLKVVSVEDVQTYWTTEIQSQPYVVQETYEEEEPYLTSETRTTTVFDSYIGYGWSYSFQVPQENSTVSLSLLGMPYYWTKPFYYIYEDQILHPEWPYYDWYYDGCGNNKVTIKVSYPEEVTSYRVVSKTRDVTKYRDVPVQVKKEKAETRYIRMSLWQYLFWDGGKDV